MASLEFPVRRVIVAGGFALAVAIAPAIGFFADPGSAGTQNVACPAGLEEDPYTYACVPHTVPGGGVIGGVGGAGGAPSEQELIACSGGNRSKCLEDNLYGSPGANVPIPNTQVQP